MNEFPVTLSFSLQLYLRIVSSPSKSASLSHVSLSPHVLPLDPYLQNHTSSTYFLTYSSRRLPKYFVTCDSRVQLGEDVPCRDNVIPSPWQCLTVMPQLTPEVLLMTVFPPWQINTSFRNWLFTWKLIINEGSTMKNCTVPRVIFFLIRRY